MTHLQMELSGHRALRAVEAETPRPGPGHVLLAVEAASLCPTDVKKWDDAALAERLGGRGLVLGHEFAGTVVETSDGDEALLGMRAAVDPVLRCGACRACTTGRPGLCTSLLGIGAAAGDPVACAGLAATTGITGGFSERAIVPAANLIPIPAAVGFAAASLVEPLADVVCSVEAAGLRAGERAAVIGLGAMGLLHLDVLADRGVQAVGVDVRDDRLAQASAHGAPGVTPEQLDEVDVVFVVAGGAGHVPAALRGLEALAPGGRVVLFSSASAGRTAPIDTNRLHYRRQRIVGVVGFERHHAAEAVSLLERGAVAEEAIRTPSVALAELSDAFEAVGEPGALKPAIRIGAAA
ncbi:alcohol dehydrogenase catalytic domain-containing protein [Microbacterium betulae]|uniref:Alcohol dehydrogenase catalytic domain-containing protein n=1 Tax=Microbacterium betulae TaxID=2981139 RepID=A0AA97FG90_9MICO|nr:alcohol dehydrogenase catalytic domain-containing protein [Microbacterium sp. AB]WOF22986.1 alcohol dehydrogenase catalytic domain-containing protein [Microbacterium sp. AB]